MFGPVCTMSHPVYVCVQEALVEVRSGNTQALQQLLESQPNAAPALRLTAQLLLNLAVEIEGQWRGDRGQ